MKKNKFAPKVTQAFDIPPKVRISLYVATGQFGQEFDEAVFDNRLLRSIAEGPFDKHERAQLMEAKLSGMLRFEHVEAAPAVKPMQDFLKYLQVEEQVEETILQADHLVEVTAVEPLSQAMLALKIVHFAASFLATELNGIILEPYSLKVYNRGDKMLDQLLKVEDGTPSLKPFLNVVQSVSKGQKLLTTTHGLSRFGLPDFRIKDCKPALAEPLAFLIRGLAQSFFEDVLRVKNEGNDRYSLKKPLAVTFEHLKKGNLEDLPAPSQTPQAQLVSLKLSRSLSSFSVDLAFYGRQEERATRLNNLLSGLGLLPAQ